MSSIGAKVVTAFANGNQVQSVIEERPYDRVRAASHSPSSLGIAIKRLRGDGDPKPGNINDVVLLLHKEVFQKCEKSKRLDPMERGRLVKMAVVEWMNPHCSSCRGAGEMWTGDPDAVQKDKRGQLLATCQTCNGTKVRRYSDDERGEVLGRPLTPNGESVVAWALRQLMDSEINVNTTAARMLAA